MPTFTVEAIGGLTARLLWLGLMHGLWIGLLVAAAVALLFQARPRLSRRSRHATLLAAMIVVAIGPGAVAILHHLVLARAMKVERPHTRTTFAIEAGTSAGMPTASSAADSSAAGAAPMARFAFAARAMIRAVEIIQAARRAAVCAWSLAAATLGAILVVGAVGLQRLCRRAEPAPLAFQDRCRRLARLLRLRRVPRVLIHPRLAEPFLCGILRPTILLPGCWAGSASATSLDAILAHELAHARRLDHLINLAQRLVEAGWFFHPAIHWLSRSLRREREICADALAVRLTGDPLALAEALQSVARLRLGSPALSAVGASLGSRSPSLLPRIQELIGMTPPRPRFPVWSLVALPVAGFLAFIAVGAGLAQDRPSPLPRESRIDPDAVKNQAPHRPAAEDRPMVRYEIRFIVGPSEGWRKLLLPRIKLVKQEADFAAWSLDDRALTELLTFAQSHTTTKVLSAPKVLVDDGAKATVKTRSQRFYVADVESTDEPAPGFRPVIKSVDEGITLGMTGLIRPHATRLSVEVVEEAVLGFHTMGREKRVGDRTISGQYQIPTTAKRSWQLDTEIPEGAQLLISLGLRDETRSLSDVASLANGILARVGLPEYPPATLTMEAMVLIMPRHATPEDPKPSARSGSRSTASANGLGR